MKYNINNSYVSVFYHETWHYIKKIYFYLYLGIDENEELTEEIIKAYMDRYYI